MSWRIKLVNACVQGYDFALQYETPQEAWEACPRGDWMCWVMEHLAPHKKLEMVALLAKWIWSYDEWTPEMTEMLLHPFNLSIEDISNELVEHEFCLMYDLADFAAGRLTETLSVFSSLWSGQSASVIDLNQDIADLIRKDIPDIQEWLDE